MERLYTIPVNEAFDEAVTRGGCTCPLCLLHDKLEENELDLILGASMMEPDIRIQTNEQGFCGRHYDRMFAKKNRLGLALMMESHLAELEKDFRGGAVPLPGLREKHAEERLEKMKNSCYLCGRVEFQFGKMLSTAALLFEEEIAFRKKAESVGAYCIPHARRYLECARKEMSRRAFPVLRDTVLGVERAYLEKLGGDVSTFCKKFDYRYADEPWGDSKDAVERTIRFLTGTER